MSRSEMLAHMTGNLMLEEGDKLLGWAMGPSGEKALDDAADDTAQATDCYFAEQVADLIVNQSEYCFPKIYKPKGWYAVDKDGNRLVLVPQTARQLDRHVLGSGIAVTNTGTGQSAGNRTGWRTWAAADIPTYRVMSGQTSFHVAPVAKATRAGGIIVAGFALTTLPRAGRERHQWDLPGDQCPLSATAQNAAILKGTANLARQMKAKDPAFRALEMDYLNEWRLACGEIASHAAKIYRGSR